MRKLTLLAVLLLTACATKDYGPIVCEPNGGPCHSAAARVLPISGDEVNALYFSPDVYSVAQGYVGATASNRWGTLFTPDRSGVFFTQATAEWDGTVPATCGAPGKFKSGAYVGYGPPSAQDLATAERVPSELTTACAIYVPFSASPSNTELTALITLATSKAAPDGLNLICVDQSFTVTDCVVSGAGAFVSHRDSPLARVRFGDALMMPPINTASR